MSPGSCHVLENRPKDGSTDQDGGRSDEEGLPAVCRTGFFDDTGNEIDVDFRLADSAESEADQFTHQVAFALDD